MNRSTGTVQSPSWDVQVPLQIPPHHTALCSVESFITSAPSLFDSSYFTVGVNMCMKKTLSLATYTDCWNTADVVGGVSLQSIFLKTATMDMTYMFNLATVLVLWVQNCPELVIGIPALQYAVSTLQIGVNTYVGITTNTVLTTVSEDTPTDTSAVINDVYTLLISQPFPQIQLKTTSGDSVFTLHGTWLKCLGLNASTFYTVNNTQPLTLIPRIHGYQYININANFGRSVLTSNEVQKLVPSDVIWTVPCPQDPGQCVYFSNFLSEGKIPFNNPIMETVELYVTDEVHDPLLSMKDWTVVLTFDYLPLEPRQQALTSKRARRTLATV